MLPETQPADRIAFGSFELETASGELFRDGRRIRLSGQPADLLVMLVRRGGQLVSREELRVALWPEDTFVDFDHGLNNCIRRIRDALGDPSDSPRFIETLPKKGYRFIAETRPVLPPQNVLTFPVLESAALEPETADTTPIHEDVLQVPISRWKRLRPWAISLFTIVVALFLFFVGSLILKHRSKPADFHSVVLLPLTNLSGDSSQDYLSDGVTDELITELAQATGVPVISRTSAMVYKGKQKPIPVIARELGVDAVVEGALNRTGDRLRMTVHLIDGARDKSLWAQSYDGDMSNVRELEIKVAADLAAHLRAPATTRTPIGPPRPIAPEAYEEYLKGQYFWGGLSFGRPCDTLNARRPLSQVTLPPIVELPRPIASWNISRLCLPMSPLPRQARRWKRRSVWINRTERLMRLTAMCWASATGTGLKVKLSCNEPSQLIRVTRLSIDGIHTSCCKGAVRPTRSGRSRLQPGWIRHPLILSDITRTVSCVSAISRNPLNNSRPQLSWIPVPTGGLALQRRSRKAVN